MISLAAYLLLFLAVGVGFIFVHLVAGKLIRPNKPDAEKGTIYECGEPTIGSAWVQFDLRFYVVALLFVIFDVEVAFFFPWAEVFGKANAIANTPTKLEKAEDYKTWSAVLLDLAPKSTDHNLKEKRERWTRLGKVTDEKLELVAALNRKENEKQREYFKSLKRPELAVILQLTPDQQKAIQAEIGKFSTTTDATFARIDEEFKALGSKGTDEEWKQEMKDNRRIVKQAALEELKFGRVPLFSGLRTVPPPGQPQPLRQKLNALPKQKVEDLIKFIDGKATKELQNASETFLTALKASEPEQSADAWLRFSANALQGAATIDLGAFKSLDADLFFDADNLRMDEFQAEARGLAWLALVEVLIFFGVLLVGFAYLWRRGDLEWVRSTAAERLESRGLTPPTTPGSPPTPVGVRETAAAGH